MSKEEDNKAVVGRWFTEFWAGTSVCGKGWPHTSAIGRKSQHFRLVFFRRLPYISMGIQGILLQQCCNGRANG